MKNFNLEKIKDSESLLSDFGVNQSSIYGDFKKLFV